MPGADLTVAKLALSGDLGRAAAAPPAGRASGWPGHDLWKAPKTKPIAYQDASFTDFLDPPVTITCWVTLDDTYRDAGIARIRGRLVRAGH
jgi:hypothetical protein